jgi:hypothetical protein
MESIITKTPFIKGDYIRQNQAYWKYHSRKFWRQIAFYFVLSISFLILGTLAKTEEEPSNPFVFIGIIFIILTFTILYLRIFQRLAYNRKIKAAATRFDEIKLDNIIEFTDDYLKYIDKEKTLEYKWEAFSSYSLYKNFLFLSAEFSLITAFIFENKGNDQDDFDNIYNLINQKVKFKK